MGHEHCRLLQNHFPPERGKKKSHLLSFLCKLFSLFVAKGLNDSHATLWQGLISRIRRLVPACFLILIVKVGAVPYCDSTGVHPNGHMDTGWDAVKVIAISPFPYKCYAQLVSGIFHCLGFSQIKLTTDNKLVTEGIWRCSWWRVWCQVIIT